MSTVNGVTQYIKVKVDIFFEPDHFDCAHCPILETYSRNQCRKTGEYIIDTRGRGRWCPFDDKEVELA